MASIKTKELSRFGKGLLVGVGILTGILILLLFLVYVTEPNIKVRNIKITNLTDSSATVTWISETPSVGSVIVSTDNKFDVLTNTQKVRFYDDRDTGDQNWILQTNGMQRYTHSVTITNLNPESKYYYRIAGNYKTVDTTYPALETLATQDTLSTPDPMYGSFTPLVDLDSLVYVQLNDGLLLSSTLNDQESFSLDKTNARVAYKAGDKIDVKLYGRDSYLEYQGVVGQDQPLDLTKLIDIGKVTEGFVNLSASLLTNVYACQCGAGSVTCGQTVNGNGGSYTCTGENTFKYVGPATSNNPTVTPSNGNSGGSSNNQSNSNKGAKCGNMASGQSYCNADGHMVTCTDGNLSNGVACNNPGSYGQESGKEVVTSQNNCTDPNQEFYYKCGVCGPKGLNSDDVCNKSSNTCQGSVTVCSGDNIVRTYTYTGGAYNSGTCSVDQKDETSCSCQSGNKGYNCTTKKLTDTYLTADDQAKQACAGAIQNGDYCGVNNDNLYTCNSTTHTGTVKDNCGKTIGQGCNAKPAGTADSCGPKVTVDTSGKTVVTKETVDTTTTGVTSAPIPAQGYTFIISGTQTPGTTKADCGCGTPDSGGGFLYGCGQKALRNDGKSYGCDPNTKKVTTLTSVSTDNTVGVIKPDAVPFNSTVFYRDYNENGKKRIACADGTSILVDMSVNNHPDTSSCGKPDCAKDDPNNPKCANYKKDDCNKNLKGGTSIKCNSTETGPSGLIPSDCHSYTTPDCSGSSVSLLNGLTTPVNASAVLGVSDTSGLKVNDTGTYKVTTSGDYVVTTDEVKVTEQNANGVQIKFFYDLNGDGIKQDNEQYITEPLQVSIQKLTDIETISLKEGWNMIGDTIIVTGLTTAKDLLNEITKQGGYATNVAAYRSGKWIMYTMRAGVELGKNFNLIPGEGYFVRVHKAVNLQLEGKKMTSGESDYYMSTGWNLMSLVPPTGMMATGLIDKINANSLLVSDVVTRYQSGRYENVVKDTGTIYGQDFGLTSVDGYFVRLTKGGSTLKL